jgi:hypothetical protein
MLKVMKIISPVIDSKSPAEAKAIPILKTLKKPVKVFAKSATEILNETLIRKTDNQIGSFDTKKTKKKKML